jgi:hypothetical protein
VEGFVVKEGEGVVPSVNTQLPFPINTAEDLLHWCRENRTALFMKVVMENENTWRPENETRQGILNIFPGNAGVHFIVGATVVKVCFARRLVCQKACRCIE